MNLCAKTTLAAFAAALVCTQAIAETPSYRLTAIQQAPNDPSKWTGEVSRYSATAPVINNTGEIAWGRNAVVDFPPSYHPYPGYFGEPDDGFRAVLYQDRTYLRDIAPIAANNYAYAINDHGSVVGQSYTMDTVKFTDGRYSSLGPINPFLYENGHTIDIGRTINGTVYSFGTANAINNNGQVVGTLTKYLSADDDYVYSTGSPQETAFIYGNGHLSTLGSLVPGGESIATDISDNGHVVGAAWANTEDGYETVVNPGRGQWHAFIHHNGEIKDLTPADSLSFDTHATAVNNLGVAVGSRSDSAVIFKEGELIVIGRGVASDINDKGIVVGTSFKFAGGEGRYGFVYQDGEMHELSNLLASQYSGWQIELARQINQGGEIVALAKNPVTRISEYVVLSPVPESSVLWMSAFGVLVCMVAGRRRRLLKGS